ncbi:MAG TPA: hypothetical protein VJN18_25070 [Polyangiaceae bacterium]|nr:hypothetical protein [Polyangiaceae bacterium]
MSASANTVAVPISAITQLFDMGNYSSSPYDGTKLSAVDLARNIIRHAAIELQVLGDCIGAERTITDADLCSHCWRLSAQYEAAIEIINAMDGTHAAPESETVE